MPSQPNWQTGIPLSNQPDWSSLPISKQCDCVLVPLPNHSNRSSLSFTIQPDWRTIYLSSELRWSSLPPSNQSNSTLIPMPTQPNWLSLSVSNQPDWWTIP